MLDSSSKSGRAMRRYSARAISLVVASGLALVAAALAPGVVPRDADAQPAPSPTPGCATFAQKTVAPSQVLLGETATVTLEFRRSCTGVAPGRVRVVLVIGRLPRERNDELDTVKAAASALVRRLDLNSRPHIEVGVVEYGDAAWTRCPVTNNEQRVLTCVNRVRHDSGQRMDLGIEEGLRVLLRGRRNVVDRERIAEIIVVFAADPPHDCKAAEAAALRAEAQGALVVTVCAGEQCPHRPCLEQVASSPRDVYGPGDRSALVQAMQQLGDMIVGTATVDAFWLTLRDTVGPDMDLVLGSASPAPASVQGDTVRWEVRFVPDAGLTFTVQVRPRSAGRHPTNASAEARFNSWLTDVARRSVTFPVPHVNVLAPATAPTPDATNTPTATATATPTITPSATQPLPRVRIYLPVAGKHMPRP